MEAKDMATPEKEHRVFKATTTLPRREIPIHSKPIPSQLEKPKESWIKSKIARIGLSLLALGGMAGIYEAYHHDLLPIHEVSSTFDNSQYSGAIGKNNTIEIDEDTLSKIATTPATKTPKRDVNLLLPIQDLPLKTNISYDKLLALGKGSIAEAAKKQEIKNTIAFRSIPKDSIVLAPADGSIQFYKRPESPEGVVDSANLLYKGPEGLYQILIFGQGTLFKPLINVTPRTTYRGADDPSFHAEVKRGQPIFMTVQLGDLMLTNQVWPSGQFGVGLDQVYPNNINLITIIDKTGQEKVVVLGK